MTFESSWQGKDRTLRCIAALSANDPHQPPPVIFVMLFI